MENFARLKNHLNKMMMTKKTSVVIFDWDDTLFDAGNALAKSQIHAIENILTQTERYPFTQTWQCPNIEHLREHTGHRFKEKVIYAVMPELQANNPDHQAWAEDVFERFKQYYQRLNKTLFPGVKAMLMSLKTSCDLCIATNKSRDIFMEELQQTGLADMFTHIICGDDPAIEGQFKPNPKMINLIQNQYPNATSFVMVGDRDFDMTAATTSEQSQRTKTIGISKTLSLVQADQQLTNAAKISLDLIQRLNRQTTLTSS